MTTRPVLVLAWLLAALWPANPVRADRDIVYAARYYYPPSVHKTSHFHLYRINPDGTGRTQLTFGNADEEGSLWSPDGRSVLFVRRDSSGASALCLVGATGGAVTMLGNPDHSSSGWWSDCHWAPDSRTVSAVHQHWARNSSATAVYLLDVRTRRARRLPGVARFSWSPDGRSAALQDGDGYAVRALKTGRTIRLKGVVRFPAWQDSGTLAALGAAGPGRYDLRLFAPDGHETRRMPIRFSRLADGETTEPQAGADDLLAIPNSRDLVYALNNHNSTVGVDYLFFRLSPATGRARSLTQGQFLAWAPDGATFCAAPGRDTSFYARWPNGRERTVWTAPLYVRAAAGGKMRALTPRLSWVTGADWRKPRVK